MSTMTLDIIPDDLRNCVIKDRASGSQLYSVNSPTTDPRRTTISRAGVEGKDASVLAQVRYHNMFRSDTITLGEGDHTKKMTIRSWLKPATRFYSLPVHLDLYAKKYIIRLDNKNLALCLSSSDSKPDGLEPIALFEGSHRPNIPRNHPRKSTSRIILYPASLDIQDEVVIALLVLTERLRGSEMSDGSVDYGNSTSLADDSHYDQV